MIRCKLVCRWPYVEFGEAVLDVLPPVGTKLLLSEADDSSARQRPYRVVDVSITLVSRAPGVSFADARYLLTLESAG